MPRVSVLLTCYNHVAYLPVAVESIRSQSFTDWEIVAIDDGSTDGTREWLADNLSGQTVILNDSNLGTYASLNVALDRAQGDFVAILNDDDAWAPHKLARQIELMNSHPNVGLVHSDGWFIDRDGHRIEGSPLGFEFPRTETGDVLLALLYQNKIIASAALVRKSCFESLGGFNQDYFGSGDWEMWLRIAESFEVGYVDEPLTFYRVHGGNASHKHERIWRDDERLREWIRSRYPSYAERGYPPSRLRAAIAHNEACLGTIYTLNGNPSKGRKAYAESIKHCPLRIKSYARWLATMLSPRAFRRSIRL